MDTQDHKCCSSDGKREETSHRIRYLLEDEMPQQSKKKLWKEVRQIISPTDLRTLQWLTEKTPIQEKTQKPYHRSVLVQRSSDQADFPPQQQQQDDRNHPQQSKTYRKNYQSSAKQQQVQKNNDRYPRPSPTSFQHHSEEQYPKTTYHNSPNQHQNPQEQRQHSQQPYDDQTEQNPAKMMQYKQQTKYQNHPTKDYPPQTPSEELFQQHPPDVNRLSPYHKTTNKHSHGNRHTENQTEDDRKNPYKMMQQNLQTEYEKAPKMDPYEDHTQKPTHNQFKQKPPEEYRVSPYHNSTEKHSHGSPQNMQHYSNDEQPLQNPNRLMKQNLQTEYQKGSKKEPYEDHSEQPTPDQFKQKPPEQYRVSPYHNSTEKHSHGSSQNMQHSSRKVYDEHPPKDPDKMIQQNLPKEYQKAPKMDPYEDHPQQPTPDQFKQKPLEQYRVSPYHNSTQKHSHGNRHTENQTEDDRKNPYKMMQQNLQTEYEKAPKMDPYEDHTQKPTHNQFKQKPPEEYRVSPYHNSTEKHSHESSQNMQHSSRKVYDEQPPKNPDKMMQQNLPKEYQKAPKKDPYEDHTQRPTHNQFKQKPPEEYRVSPYHNSTEKHSHESSQNMQHSSRKVYDEQPPKNPDKMMQQNLPKEYQKAPKKDPYEDHPQKPCQDQLSDTPEDDSEESNFGVDKETSNNFMEYYGEGSPKYRPKHILSGDEHDVFSMASSNSVSTSISAKSGNELRAMIWDEMELQSVDVEENVSIFLDLSQPRDDGNQDMKETMSKHPKIASLPNLAIDVNAPTTDSFKGSKTDELPQIECSMSIDDLVNCKVITPMIMKIHNKYMTSMQDAMQLMKYLETVPRLVGQIYKDNITLEKRKH
ncbi:putative uncharacterized protein DDB_G0271606 [Drosophila persimilis]|uniref:putative uncharacterized protein DDB_G0271606 n=1 Tax=Drosophila persimilis TaxID=7234 RepID=UPI000F084DF9|nr:putative uncharacterized protein DDB_G0271606 [Drosophila persimilis]